MDRAAELSAVRARRSTPQLNSTSPSKRRKKGKRSKSQRQAKEEDASLHLPSLAPKSSADINTERMDEYLQWKKKRLATTAGGNASTVLLDLAYQRLHSSKATKKHGLGLHFGPSAEQAKAKREKEKQRKARKLARQRL